MSHSLQHQLQQQKQLQQTLQQQQLEQHKSQQQLSRGHTRSLHSFGRVQGVLNKLNRFGYQQPLIAPSSTFATASNRKKLQQHPQGHHSSSQFADANTYTGGGPIDNETSQYYSVLLKLRSAAQQQQQRNNNNNDFIHVLDSKTIALKSNVTPHAGVMSTSTVATDLSLNSSSDNLLASLTSEKTFSFDEVLMQKSTTETLARTHCTDAVIRCVRDKQNQAFYIYGPPEAGKTHLMVGSLRDPGLILFVVKEIFFQVDEVYQQLQSINTNKPEEPRITVSVFLHNERGFFDALAGMVKLSLHEGISANAAGLPHCSARFSNACLVGLSEIEVNSATQTLQLVKSALQESDELKLHYSKSNATPNRSSRNSSEPTTLTICKFAGETFATTMTRGGQRDSLTIAVNNVIRILSEISMRTRKNQHVPFTAHPLVHLLREHLAFNSKVLLIGCLPLNAHISDISSVLRHLNYAKCIRTTPNSLFDEPDSNNSAIKNDDTSNNSLTVHHFSIDSDVQSLLECLSLVITEQNSSPTSFPSTNGNNNSNNTTNNNCSRIRLVDMFIGSVRLSFSRLIKAIKQITAIKHEISSLHSKITAIHLQSYSKCVTSADAREFYLGKLSPHAIEQINLSASASISQLQQLIIQLYQQTKSLTRGVTDINHTSTLKYFQESNILFRWQDAQPKDVEIIMTLARLIKSITGRLVDSSIIPPSLDGSLEQVFSQFDSIHSLTTPESQSQQNSSQQRLQFKQLSSNSSLLRSSNGNILNDISRVSSSTNLKTPRFLSPRKFLDSQDGSSRRSSSSSLMQALSGNLSTKSMKIDQFNHLSPIQRNTAITFEPLLPILAKPTHEDQEEDGEDDDYDNDDDYYDNDNTNDDNEYNNEGNSCINGDQVLQQDNSNQFINTHAISLMNKRNKKKKTRMAVKSIADTKNQNNNSPGFILKAALRNKYNEMSANDPASNQSSQQLSPSRLLLNLKKSAELYSSKDSVLAAAPLNALTSKQRINNSALWKKSEDEMVADMFQARSSSFINISSNHNYINLREKSQDTLLNTQTNVHNNNNNLLTRHRSQGSLAVMTTNANQPAKLWREGRLNAKEQQNYNFSKHEIKIPVVSGTYAQQMSSQINQSESKRDGQVPKVIDEVQTQQSLRNNHQQQSHLQFKLPNISESLGRRTQYQKFLLR